MLAIPPVKLLCQFKFILCYCFNHEGSLSCWHGYSALHYKRLKLRKQEKNFFHSKTSKQIKRKPGKEEEERIVRGLLFNIESVREGVRKKERKKERKIMKQRHKLTN